MRFLTICSLFIMGIIMMMLTSCQSLMSALDTHISKGKAFSIATTKSSFGWGVLTHPEIAVRTSFDEPVIVSFCTVGEGIHKPEAASESTILSPAVSYDGGETWKYGSISNQYQHLRKYWYAIKGSNYTLRYKPSPFQRGSINSRAERFYDNGETIDAFISKMNMPYRWHGEFRVMEQGIELADGRLLLCATTESPYKNRKEWDVFKMISTNYGQSFEYGGVIADRSNVPSNILSGPNESAVIRAENGQLICVMRTGMTKQWGADPLTDMGSMLIGRSSDEGNTWDVKVLGIPGVNPRLIRLQNGVLVLAYGRPGNNLVFSSDDGYTWGHEIALTAADAKSSGYVAITEVRPNRLLAVYDMYDTDSSGIWLWEPKEVNGIYGCFVDVRMRGGALKDECGGMQNGEGEPLSREPKAIDLRL